MTNERLESLHIPGTSGALNRLTEYSSLNACSRTHPKIIAQDLQYACNRRFQNTHLGFNPMNIYLGVGTTELSGMFQQTCRGLGSYCDISLSKEFWIELERFKI